MSAVRVLLIAKPDAFADTFAAWLEAEGAAVTRIASGAEGLKAATGRGYDLIILDLELPDMDGLTELSGLHSGGAATAPVFLLKGEGEPAHVLQRGLDLGASGYISKHRLPPNHGAVSVLATLKNGARRQDACPFSSKHEFGRCTVFTPLSMTASDGDVEPSLTCTHLRVGTSDTWQLYPRCAIGDQAARDRYQEERTQA